MFAPDVSFMLRLGVLAALAGWSMGDQTNAAPLGNASGPLIGAGGGVYGDQIGASGEVYYGRPIGAGGWAYGRPIGAGGGAYGRPIGAGGGVYGRPIGAGGGVYGRPIGARFLERAPRSGIKHATTYEGAQLTSVYGMPGPPGGYYAGREPRQFRRPPARGLFTRGAPCTPKCPR